MFMIQFVAAVAITIIALAEEAKPVVGGLDKGVIDEYVGRHLPQLRACVTGKLISGKVSMRFTIGPDGKVTEVKPEESTLQNAEVENCVAGVIKGIEFPTPAGGGVVEVSYPFAFDSKSQGKKPKPRKRGSD